MEVIRLTGGGTHEKRSSLKMLSTFDWTWRISEMHGSRERQAQHELGKAGSGKADYHLQGPSKK